MWVWQLRRDADVDSVMRSAEQLSLAEVFLSVPWAGPDALITRTARRLRGAGIRVSCLGSESTWVRDPPLSSEWAQRALKSGGFDGVHLDVEPWQLPEWQTARAAAIAGYLAVLATVRRTARGLRVEADVAPLLATEPHGRGSALDDVLATVDAVTIMAYRDRAPAICEHSLASRTACRRAKVPYRLGIETQPLLDPTQTFRDDGRAVLRREVARVEHALAGDDLYRGIAVHDWRNWAALPERAPR